MPDPRQPIRETVGPDRAFARVWQSVRETPTERLAKLGVSARVEGDRVIVEQGLERLMIERIEDDQYKVEATSAGIAVLSTLTLTLPRDQRGMRHTA